MKPVQSTAEHKRREDAQRRAVHQRDYHNGKPCCRFEIRTAAGWKECGSTSARDTSHILPRRECAKVWDAPEVALLACRRCHNAYDGHGDGTVVRAPYPLAKIAWEHVLANSKVPPSARWNPSVNPDYQEVA